MVKDALEAVRPRLDARPVGVEPPRPVRRIVDRENLADLVERQLQLAEAGNGPRCLELLAAIAAIAG